MTKYIYPNFTTQYGGIVMMDDGDYIFIVKPDHPDFDVGDVMPKEWDVIPEDKLALHLLNNHI